VVFYTGLQLNQLLEALAFPQFCHVVPAQPRILELGRNIQNVLILSRIQGIILDHHTYVILGRYVLGRAICNSTAS